MQAGEKARPRVVLRKAEKAVAPKPKPRLAVKPMKVVPRKRMVAVPFMEAFVYFQHLARTRGDGAFGRFFRRNFAPIAKPENFTRAEVKVKVFKAKGNTNIYTVSVTNLATRRTDRYMVSVGPRELEVARMTSSGDLHFAYHEGGKLIYG